MKVVKLAINAVLFLGVIALFFWMSQIVKAPIEFRKGKAVREAAVIDRLIAIRNAQLAYEEKYGEYAAEFDKLIPAIKNDSVPRVKIIGDPDLAAEDSTYTVTYDTTMVPLNDVAFADTSRYPNQTYPVDSLRYIPFGNGEQFSLNAGELTKNRITIDVFEARAPESVYLKGLADRYIDPDFEMQVGSMSEGRINGNWE